VQYHATVRELPSDERPRERLERYGAATLQTAELLAIILRVGTPGENVVELSSRLLVQYNGLGGLLAADLSVLCVERGLGPAKAATLKAALELGRRLMVLEPGQRPQITSPGDVASLLMLEMGYLAQEQLRVLCLRTPSAKTAVTRPVTPATTAGGIGAGVPSIRAAMPIGSLPPGTAV
jgi:DNA repair protein RadC